VDGYITSTPPGCTACIFNILEHDPFPQLHQSLQPKVQLSMELPHHNAADDLGQGEFIILIDDDAARYSTAHQTNLSSSSREMDGHEAIAQLMGVEDSRVFRRFDQLWILNVLHLQNQLFRVSNELANEDYRYPGEDNERISEIMRKVEDMLLRYSQYYFEDRYNLAHIDSM
jgi:hypothetical protein